MTINDMLHKVIAYGFGALSVGAGTMIVTINRNDGVQDTKISALQVSMAKIDEVDSTVRQVNAKVDVLNQKLDDAKEALNRH